MTPEEKETQSSEVSSDQDTKPDTTVDAVQDSPADALSRTPEDLDNESQASVDSNQNDNTQATTGKQPSKIKQLLKKANVYFLLFLLIVIVAAVVTVVYYLNSRKTPVVPGVADQPLTQKTLQQLANKDASVGDTSQTLTIKGNAVINGQTLMRGNLNIAGNLQTGGSIQGSALTISGKSNLNDTQINSLQVAQNTAIQGSTTLRDLNVAGTSTFSGAMTAAQISVTNLILSGNASLRIPNHLSFTGPSPGRSINGGVLGAGGSASVNGSDTSGSVNINTGNNPAAGCFVQINFSKPFSGTPRVIISPIGFGAGKVAFYATRTSNNFSICTSSPAPAHQHFAFDYFIAG